MANILIVEDDKTINNGIAFNLQCDGFHVISIYDLNTARQTVNKDIDLIILDVNLPDGNGFDFCKEVRMEYSMPILFLTACDLELDEITGFRVGGDDYITKPFSLIILRERILSLLRRYKRFGDGNKNTLVEGEFILDLDKLMVTKGSENLQLAPTEFKLLKKFIENKGRVLTRENLLEELWSKDAQYIEEHALTVNINRLRKKIEDDSSKHKYIKTVYGMGYIWVGEEL